MAGPDSANDNSVSGVEDPTRVTDPQQATEETQKQDAALPKGPEDEAKKKKKEEKAREKELKKQKAAEKAAAAAAAKAAQGDKPTKAKKEKKEKEKEKEGEESSGSDKNPFTAPGDKKNLSPEMAKAFNPSAVEASWYEWWEKSGFFKADNQSKKPPFTIVVPPPNVTGALHIGHALTAAVEDTIVRWRRMSGYNVCWVPGVDHAGIATQVVVEKKLQRERGVTRHDIGREAFVEEVWKWKNEYGSRICNQQRRMGASLDWSRECFTMDSKLSDAVTEAFVRLHQKGLLYRDDRLVNWDCVLLTAISDIEVDYKDIPGRTLLSVPGHDDPVEFGVLTSFAYPLEESDKESDKESEGGVREIVVATTRPETMLGDTAVAVHPEDERYKSLHGRFVIHPFNGRRIPIICDAELVDMSFGTGAVKITPAHDPNDLAVGRRHGLESVNILSDNGRINNNGGDAQFIGLKRFEARVKVVEALKDKGLFRGVADNPMRLGVCSRSGDVIEPMLKPQWYVKCGETAELACQLVREGKLEIIPKEHADTWFRWLESIRDWCISRQLWWGHRVPAWYATVTNDPVNYPNQDFGAYADNWIVARNEDEAKSLAGTKFKSISNSNSNGQEINFKLEQDPDVLDTWFSSGLFPFSVFGWPSPSPDFKAFYPTTLLETGHDILFFWVWRMVFMGLTLTDTLPFKQVFLHAMVRDAHGRKMSKSLGNVIDPLEVIQGVSLEQLHKKLESGNLDPRELEKAKAGQSVDFPSGIPECGCDALRFALIAYTKQWMNINLDIMRVVGYRLWCNKLWNAIRFAMMNLGENFTPPSLTLLPPVDDSDTSATDEQRQLAPRLSFSFSGPLPLSCRWILSTLNTCVRKSVAALQAYKLDEATDVAYEWWQYKLCDVFIEVTKPTLSSSLSDPHHLTLKQVTREVLWVCLDTGLRVLHPMMPFVTEELWQRLPRDALYSHLSPSIVVAPYPGPLKEWEDEEAERVMERGERAVKAIRSLRVNYGVQTKQKTQCFFSCKSTESTHHILSSLSEISALAMLSSAEVLTRGVSPPRGCALAIVDESVTAHVLLKGVVDPLIEIQKLKKRKDETNRRRDALRKKMEIAGYDEKVPQNVREENSTQASRLDNELSNIDEAVANFERLVIDEKGN